MEIGKTIRKKRKEAKISLRELSSKIGVSYTFLSRIEVGQRNVSIELLQQISKVLETNYLELLIAAGYVTEEEIILYKDGKSNSSDNDLINEIIKSEFTYDGEALTNEQKQKIITMIDLLLN